jgi:ribosomal-protein-alanine N-acetyltransferase
VAIAVYESRGFNEVGRRQDYYPAARGREDALVLARQLI